MHQQFDLSVNRCRRLASRQFEIDGICDRDLLGIRAVAAGEVPCACGFLDFKLLLEVHRISNDLEIPDLLTIADQLDSGQMLAGCTGGPGPDAASSPRRALDLHYIPATVPVHFE